MSLPLAISDFSTLIFDCDGVVLDSNRVKTDAFYKTTLSYGESSALAMVDYHVANGGISRYKKFAHFLEQIVPGRSGPNLGELLESYAVRAREGMLSCSIAPGLEDLRRYTFNARWLIVSGGDQDELRDIFSIRGIAKLFDGGIFGSPDTKDMVLARESALGNISQPALFLGDSHYDYKASRAAGFDFVFINAWSEWQPDEEWMCRKGIHSARFLKDLIDE